MPPRITNSFTNDINITNGDITITTAPTLNTIAWDVATNATTAWNPTYAAINDVTTNFRRHTVSANDFRDAVNGWFNNATTTMVYHVDPGTDTVRIDPDLIFPCGDSCEDWDTPELDSFIDSFAKKQK